MTYDSKINLTHIFNHSNYGKILLNYLNSRDDVHVNGSQCH